MRKGANSDDVEIMYVVVSVLCSRRFLQVKKVITIKDHSELSTSETHLKQVYWT